jgi:SAM-dependent methyltransferase
VEFDDFVLTHLGAAPRRVLEVGCGAEGGVTPALLAAGHEVVAIDPRAPEGEPYLRTTLEEFEGGPFDAVVAGRMLHHVDPLGEAVDKLARLAPLLLVDEFAWNHLDPPTQAWYEGRHAELSGAGAPPLGPPDLDQWRWRHPGLHPYETLRDALAERFELSELEWRPYLYRWLGDDAFAAEAELIDAGEIRAIGYRIVAVIR